MPNKQYGKYTPWKFKKGEDLWLLYFTFLLHLLLHEMPQYWNKYKWIQKFSQVLLEFVNYVMKELILPNLMSEIMMTGFVTHKRKTPALLNQSRLYNKRIFFFKITISSSWNCSLGTTYIMIKQGKYNI